MGIIGRRPLVAGGKSAFVEASGSAAASRDEMAGQSRHGRARAKGALDCVRVVRLAGHATWGRFEQRREQEGERRDFASGMRLDH